ncbi:hypothetical protein [Nonomuraea angiospora]|uniref:hypothetical protein n=1 Tax=Nonomuraea angiospora TaxID=46172 RepID=UPI0029B3DD1D|nr:hypothetical protein [Nonomuraea angiospora]MDX3109559.1 hypothetical protein [Nonomuraea angiospora]
MPRVIYQRLPEDQDWSVSKTDDEGVIIIINEALEGAARKRAWRTAYRSIRGLPAWMPIPVVVAGDWVARKTHTPMGSAVTASVLTAAAIYGVTSLDGDEHPSAEPPIIVTVQPTPTPAVTPSRKPSSRSTRAPEPTLTGGPPTVITVVHPTRSTPPMQPPTRRPLRSPHPSQQSSVRATTAAPGPGGTPTSAAVDTPTPPPPAATSPPGIVAESSNPAAPQPAASSCGGIALGVDLDPLANVDACLLG